MPEEWTTFTPTTVHIGDRVHSRLNEDAMAVTTMQKLSGGGRRLYLADGSTSTSTSVARWSASAIRSPGCIDKLPPPGRGV